MKIQEVYKPIGKDKVKQAILESATELFAMKGPKNVSIRDIAKDANINHALIHRHFGTKDELTAIVMKELDEQLRDKVKEPTTFKESIILASKFAMKDDRLWRIIARAMLDGYQEDFLTSDFVYMHKMVELAKEEQDKGLIRQDISAEELIGGIICLGLGTRLFEPYIKKGLNIKAKEPNAVSDKIMENWLSLIY